MPVYVQKTQNRKKKWLKNVFINTTRKKKKIIIFLFPLRGVRSFFFAEGGGALDRLVDGQFKKVQVLGKQVPFLQTHSRSLSLSRARAHTHTQIHAHKRTLTLISAPTGFSSIQYICLYKYIVLSLQCTGRDTCTDFSNDAFSHSGVKVGNLYNSRRKYIQCDEPTTRDCYAIWRTKNFQTVLPCRSKGILS